MAFERGIVLDQRKPGTRAFVGTTPVNYMAMDRPMVPEWDAATAIQEGFYASVFAYRCVQMRGQLLARLPIRCGDRDKGKENPRSNLKRFLTSNRELTWNQIIRWSSAQFDVTGRYAWNYAVDSFGLPIVGPEGGPYPLISQHLRPIPDTGANPRYFGGYEYWTADTSSREGRIKKLSLNEVFYAWRPSQHDLRQPESQLRGVAMNVSILNMIERFSFAFLMNSAQPATVVIHEAFASSEETLAFRDQWNSRFRGADNAGRPVFVEFEDGDAKTAVDVRTLGLTQRDAQMVQQYKEQITAICVGFGIPLSALGDASGRTFNNAGEEGRNLWELTMEPLMEEHEGFINQKLAPLLGSDEFWFDTVDVPALKPARRFIGVSMAEVLLVASKNEARADFGLEPLDDPDADLVAEPIEVEEVEQLPAAEDLPVVPPPLVLSKEPTPVRSILRHKGEHGPHKKAVSDPAPEIVAGTALLALHRSQARQVRATWTRSTRDLFARMHTSTSSRLNGKRGRQFSKRVQGERVDVTGFFDPAYWGPEAMGHLRGLMEPLAIVGATRLGPVDLDQVNLQAYINAEAARLGQALVEGVEHALASTLGEGLQASEETDALTNRVEAIFEELTETDAGVVADQEAAGFLHGAQILAARQTGAGGLEWVPAGGGRHDQLAGEWGLFGHGFEVAQGVKLTWPGDPLGPADQVHGCDCTIRVLDAGEVAARSGAQVELRKALALIEGVDAGLVKATQVRSLLGVA